MNPADPTPALKGETATEVAAEDTERWYSRIQPEAYAMPVLMILVVIFFSLWGKTSDTYSSSANLQIVLGGQAVLAIVALAALVPLVCNQWDLSVGAVAGLSAVFVASALSSGWPIILGLALGVVLGATVGLINALLVTKVGTNAVITTLGTAAIVAGVINQKTNGVALVSEIPNSVVDFGSGKAVLGIPNTALVLIVAAVVVYYVLGHTAFGRYLYALGSNPEAARLTGLRTSLLLATTFVISGTLAGTAGALQVSYAAGADPRVGEGFTLPALAAAFLSAAAIKPGRYNVGGVLVAIFFLAALNSGLSLAGAQPYVSQYVNGAALIVGVGMAVAMGRRRAGSTVVVPE